MLLLGGNGTWGIKSFRKWPLLWDGFVPPRRGLQEPAVSWGCPARDAETLREGGDRKFCLFLLTPHDLQSLSLALIVVLCSQPTGQALQPQPVCRKALLFVRSFGWEHRWRRFNCVISCIWSYQAFLCWPSSEAWSSSIIWSAAWQELCFAPSNWYKIRHEFPNSCGNSWVSIGNNSEAVREEVEKETGFCFATGRKTQPDVTEEWSFPRTQGKGKKYLQNIFPLDLVCPVY